MPLVSSCYIQRHRRLANSHGDLFLCTMLLCYCGLVGASEGEPEERELGEYYLKGIHVLEKWIGLPQQQQQLLLLLVVVLVLVLFLVQVKDMIKFGCPYTGSKIMASQIFQLPLFLLTANALVKPVAATTGNAFIDGYELALAINNEQYLNISSVYGHPINDWDVSGMLLLIYSSTVFSTTSSCHFTSIPSISTNCCSRCPEF